MNEVIDRSVLGLGALLRVYHRHQLRGVSRLQEALQAQRPVLLVGNHCMDVADPLMLRTAIHEVTGRALRFIGHEMMFFRFGPIRELAAGIGAIPSRDPSLAARVLRESGLLMLYPGAGAEAALRSYRREPYRLKWYGRTGFVELALRTHATVLFAAGVGIDEMFYQTDVRIPDALFDLVDGSYLEQYRGLRLQIGALGPHVVPGLLPLPVRVSHVISPPLPIDYDVDPDDRAALEALQIRAWARCQEHLDYAVASRHRATDLVDRVLRRGESWLQAIGV